MITISSLGRRQRIFLSSICLSTVPWNAGPGTFQHARREAAFRNRFNFEKRVLWRRRFISLINGSLSGELLPAMPLDDYLVVSESCSAAGDPAWIRGSDCLWLTDRMDAWSWRANWQRYFKVYGEEARDRGLPLIRALPMQFPKDTEAAKSQRRIHAGR